jgi:acetyltransferase, GNAT family
MIRLAKEEDLYALLQLYLHLHETSIPEINDKLTSAWKRIQNNPDHSIIIAEEDRKLVSSCTCIIIPNITRCVRPYAIIENVVTHQAYRHRGLASAVLNYAKEIAKTAGCYKMLLQTGSKEQSVLNFYRRAGYNSEDNTAFVQWLP